MDSLLGDEAGKFWLVIVTDAVCADGLINAWNAYAEPAVTWNPIDPDCPGSIVIELTAISVTCALGSITKFGVVVIVFAAS